MTIQESAISGTADSKIFSLNTGRKNLISECNDLVEMMSLLREELKVLGITLLINW